MSFFKKYLKKYEQYVNKIVGKTDRNYLIPYPTPKNLNYNWNLGFLSGFCLIIQILTGLFLSRYYIPKIAFASLSVEHIIRNVNCGWLIHYLHAYGAFMFLFLFFFHIFRSLYFGSYVIPRSHLWFSGILTFFLIMATIVIGFVLPWNPMSFWLTTALTNLFSAVPGYGPAIVKFVWSFFSAAPMTLNRLFSLHILLTMSICVVAFAHLGLVYNRDLGYDPLRLGANIKKRKYIYPSIIPYYSPFFVKDLFFFILFKDLIVFCFVGPSVIFIFFYFLPIALEHANTYIFADPLVIPAHIVPKWYFLPFYAILRSIPNKFCGVAAMLFSIAGLLFLPMFVPVKHSPKKKIFVFLHCIFIVNFFILGWIGLQPLEYPYTLIGAFPTTIYFLILYIFLPILYSIDFYFLDS